MHSQYADRVMGCLHYFDDDASCRLVTMPGPAAPAAQTKYLRRLWRLRRQELITALALEVANALDVLKAFDVGSIFSAVQSYSCKVQSKTIKAMM